MARPSCGICTALSPGQLLELDSLLGDPVNWPATVWGVFSPPKEGMSASYRRFGAMRVGREWLDDHGLESIPNATIRRHWREHVHHVPRQPSDLVEAGIIAYTDPRASRVPTNPSIDAGSFLRYFNAGIQMGEAALRLMAERINLAILRGEDVPISLISKLADQGSALARTQAQLMARGMRFTGEGDDEDDAFRGDEDDLPGPRIQHHRVRKVDGEVRPVRDEGPADRETFNRRARGEGTTELD